MADATREQDAIRAVVERLTSAFSATHSQKEVEEAVAQAHASFTAGTVREFVPVLVERKARALLGGTLR